MGMDSDMAWEDYCDSESFAEEFVDLDVTCRFCGADGLMWLEDKQGWKLHETRTGLLHFCKRKSALDDFKD